jgi:6-pyruvoyl-tetrahydropterin synthase
MKRPGACWIRLAWMRWSASRVLAAFDHRNLNAETPEFANCPPTSENLLRLIWERLRKDWEQNFPPGRRLVRVRLRETRRNSFEMMEEE